MPAANYTENLSGYIPERNIFDLTSREIREKVIPVLEWMRLHGITDLQLKSIGPEARAIVNDIQI